ncbi:MAG: hypothetical protein J6Y32_02220 [Bacteroidales bacterium]|nr:hypothetical protein [Bacteroidales bacterium]
MFGTIDYVVANPTTFIKYNSMNYDWYYSGNTSTDNTRWQSSKGLYDPCPPGWRIPDGGNTGVWAKAAGADSFSYTWDATKKGIDFSGKFGNYNAIWYPAAGCLSDGDASLDNVGVRGYWWSCTTSDFYACSLGLDSYGSVYTSNNYSRAYGRSVRCFRQ